MAIRARLQLEDQLVTLFLYPAEQRVRSTDFPQVPGYEPNPDVEFYWDDTKLEDGEFEFLGVEIRNIRWLTDEDLRAIEHVAPVRIDVPELGLHDVSPAEILRGIRDRERIQLAG